MSARPIACVSPRWTTSSSFSTSWTTANHANASFYPIDPRGLPAFDNPIGPDAPPPITVDHAMLKARIEVMRTLAEY